MTSTQFTAGGLPIQIQRWPSEIPLRVAIIVISVILWAAIIIGTFGIGLLYVGLIAFFLFCIHAAFIMHLRGSAVQIGPNQFPELYERIAQLSATAGLKKTPDAYILQADGGLNAFATKFFRGRIITLYSDLLEACGDDTTARDMIIGHEIGHLRSGHLNWIGLTAPGRIIPFLGSAYSRACEFTCDRWGAALCGDREGARRGLIVLAAGGVYKTGVNVDAYIAQQEKLNTGWMTLAKWMAMYPPLAKRVEVLSSNPLTKPISSTKGTFRALGIIAAFILVPVAIGLAIPAFIQPLMSNLGGIGRDLGSFVEPQSGGGTAPSTDGSQTFSAVSEMPAPTTPPELADARLSELAQQCFEGDMQACDNLYNETDFGSPEEEYGNSCGGRISENTLECTALVE